MAIETDFDRLDLTPRLTRNLLVFLETDYSWLMNLAQNLWTVTKLGEKTEHNETVQNWTPNDRFTKDRCALSQTQTLNQLHLVSPCTLKTVYGTAGEMFLTKFTRTLLYVNNAQELIQSNIIL